MSPELIDPLAEIVMLLQPEARFFKIVTGAGSWVMERTECGQPFYAVVLEGAYCLTVNGQAPVTLQAGDFVLIPSVCRFRVSSGEGDLSALPDSEPVALPDGVFRVGRQDGPLDVRFLVGHCSFGSPDAALLVSLLPQLVHIRGQHRLTALVQLVGDETRAQRPARDVILSRLLEVLFIEALRSSPQLLESPGLLRGLADDHLSVAIRQMHRSPTRQWTVGDLAKEAAMSRSGFFDRFKRAVGIPPMEYLLAWRMALAKKLLRRQETGVADVAQSVGYSSASTFSVAFTRFVGLTPAQYMREKM